MVSIKINVFVLLHRYKLTLSAVNIDTDTDKLINSIKRDIDRSINTENKELVYDYITYPGAIYQDNKIVIDDIINEYISKGIKIDVEYWLAIDGLEISKIKDFDTMLKNYWKLYNLSHETTKNRNEDLDKTRDEYVDKLSDWKTNILDTNNLATILAVIGNTYDLTESIIDDNKQDLSDKAITEIKQTRMKYENTSDPENEWELVNKQVDSLLKEDKELEIESCVYNGEPIEYNDLVRKLMSHVFPNYLTQINILDTLDDNYIIETNKCRIIRSIGGSLRVEIKHNKDK